MLPLIELGDKLIITQKNERDFERTYASQVGDVLEKDLILAHVPFYRGNIIQLPLGDGYTLLFYTKSDLLEAQGIILDYVTQNGIDFVKIKYRDCHHMQRRRFFRQSCFMDFTFMEVPQKPDNVVENDITVHRGIIKNLSGGGIGFISDNVLKVGGQIICHLLLNNVAFNIKGTILDMMLPEFPGEKYTYRVEFIDIERSVQEQVVQYVYYLQLESLKRMHSID